MNPDQVDLARRAVASPHWRWMPGMAGQDALGVPFRCVLPHHSGGALVFAGMTTMPADADSLARMVPDLTDPATLGCILALVREAWGDSRLVAIYCEAAHPGQSEGWAVQCADNRLPVAGEDHPTEAETLVAALEAAP